MPKAPNKIIIIIIKCMYLITVRFFTKSNQYYNIELLSVYAFVQHMWVHTNYVEMIVNLHQLFVD